MQIKHGSRLIFVHSDYSEGGAIHILPSYIRRNQPGRGVNNPKKR